MRWILRGVVVFEALRLVAWLLFLGYFMSVYSPEVGRENEAMIFVLMGALYLGFPYGSIGWFLLELGPNLPAAIDSDPVGVAISSFSFWLLGVTAVIWILRRRVVRKLARPLQATEPS